MKIFVGGTGFASFICIKFLIEKGIKPIVFDIDDEISEKSIKKIKSQSLFNEKNFYQYKSSYIGGLSNVWSGVISKYAEKDFLKWPINKNDLDPYYSEILKFFEKAEINSFYSDNIDKLLNYNFKKQDNQKNNQIYKDNELSIEFSSMLTKKVKTDDTKKNFNDFLRPYNIRSYIDQLSKESKISLIEEKIIKVSEEKNKAFVETISKLNEKRKYDCDYLFLGCGAVSSYQIIKNSFNNSDKSFKIKSSKKIVFPVKFKDIDNFKNKFFNNFPLIQVNHNNKPIYSQIYNLNPKIINFIIPSVKNFNKYFFLLNFFKNYGFSYFSIGSDYSDEFEIDNNNNIKIHKSNFEIKRIISECNLLFNKSFLNGQITHINLPFKMKSLSGNHFGAVFPMRLNKTNFFDSDTYGRVGNFKRISITDSSIFSDLPSCPPTLTILANSLRITKEIVKENFFIK